MKKALLPIILGTAILASCGSVGESNSNIYSYGQMSAEQALNLMANEKDYIILDVRTEGEYKEGHIPGAVLIPNEVIEQEAESKLTDKEARIYVYCRSGNRSKQAASKLAKMGYSNIIEIGGINDWPKETKTGIEP